MFRASFLLTLITVFCAPALHAGPIRIDYTSQLFSNDNGTLNSSGASLHLATGRITLSMVLSDTPAPSLSGYVDISSMLRSWTISAGSSVTTLSSGTPGAALDLTVDTDSHGNIYSWGVYASGPITFTYLGVPDSGTQNFSLTSYDQWYMNQNSVSPNPYGEGAYTPLNGSLQLTVTQLTPEPQTWLLFGLACGGMRLLRRHESRTGARAAPAS